MKYFNQYRIRFWISAFFQIALFAAVFLPSVKLIAIQENVVNVDTLSKSAVWYLSNAGYPEIYAIILTLFGLLSLPVILLGFKELKRYPVMIAAVTDIVYLIVNTFWTVFILVLGLNGDFATTASLTVWFWLFTALQLAQIIHLFILFFQMKKALTR